ncbi:hypothetical protein G6K91_21930 [Agrobacterium rhizogenes]|nr:hypothetical protein [Rhizobium rhizogenes]NTG56137.1 hypothetical protein [Rhizobium rhizogenes]NTH01809.1 hypothetical protein [Rhizobium rhizogenes]NTI57520.1 hypothetical protein [Rhizobium rhizogenes]
MPLTATLVHSGGTFATAVPIAIPAAVAAPHATAGAGPQYPGQYGPGGGGGGPQGCGPGPGPGPGPG